MKRYLTKLVGLAAWLVVAAGVRAQDVSELNYRGEYNAWGSTAMTYDSGGDLWRVTVQQGGPSSDFKLAHSAFTYEWTAGTSISFATPVTANTGGSNTTFTDQSGYYYTFTIYDRPSGTGSTLMVQETQNAPVTLTRGSAEEVDISGTNYLDPSDPNIYTSDYGVNTVPITLSAAPSPGEKVYIRYTTDNFSNTTVVEATGSGTDYTADIPAQSRGTTVHYYAFTTTVATPTHADRDLETVALNSNGGNGQYTTFDLGNTWHLPSSTVSGLGTATYYHLDVNDEELDLYLGNQYQGGGDAAAISSALIHWRMTGDAWGSQTPVAMSFSHTSGNDEFYTGTLDLSGFTIHRAFLEYYFEVNYSSGAVATHTHGGGEDGELKPSNQTLISGFEATAQSNPFQFYYSMNVPEPDTLVLGVFGCVFLYRLRRRSVKRG